MDSGRGRIGDIPSAGVLFLVVVAMALVYLLVGRTDRHSLGGFGGTLSSISSFFDPYSDPAYKEIAGRLTKPEVDSARFPDGNLVEATLQSDGQRLSMQTLLNRRDPCFYTITPIGVEGGYLEADFEPQGKCGKLFGQFKIDGQTITMLIRPTKQHLYPLTYIFDLND